MLYNTLTDQELIRHTINESNNALAEILADKLDDALLKIEEKEEEKKHIIEDFEDKMNSLEYDLENLRGY